MLIWQRIKQNISARFKNRGRWALPYLATFLAVVAVYFLLFEASTEVLILCWVLLLIHLSSLFSGLKTAKNVEPLFDQDEVEPEQKTLIKQFGSINNRLSRQNSTQRKTALLLQQHLDESQKIYQSIQQQLELLSQTSQDMSQQALEIENLQQDFGNIQSPEILTEEQSELLEELAYELNLMAINSSMEIGKAKPQLSLQGVNQLKQLADNSASLTQFVTQQNQQILAFQQQKQALLEQQNKLIKAQLKSLKKSQNPLKQLPLQNENLNGQIQHLMQDLQKIQHSLTLSQNALKENRQAARELENKS